MSGLANIFISFFWTKRACTVFMSAELRCNCSKPSARATQGHRRNDKRKNNISNFLCIIMICNGVEIHNFKDGLCHFEFHHSFCQKPFKTSPFGRSDMMSNWNDNHNLDTGKAAAQRSMWTFFAVVSAHAAVDGYSLSCNIGSVVRA